MSNKTTAMMMAVILIIVAVFIFGTRFIGGEDNWICENGNWIRHGNPRAPMPVSGCGDKEDKDVPSGQNNDVSGGGTTGIDASQQDSSSENIKVTSPRLGETVGLPLLIKGEARVFENTFSFRIKDEDGTVLLENQDMTEAKDAGQFGAFSLTVNYPEPKGKKGIVEVFEYSPKDGTEINKVAVPVIFRKADAMTVKVFFGNSQKDPDGEKCEVAYEIDRRIPRTQAVAGAALTELLNGPTYNESKEGYFSSINYGTKLQKLTISGGIARADFSKDIEQSVGGSCRVSAIKAQITETLKQFPTVKEVVISVDGRTDDALQP